MPPTRGFFQNGSSYGESPKLAKQLGDKEVTTFMKSAAHPIVVAGPDPNFQLQNRL